MTTYPLPTLAAQVTAVGISAPSYADVVASLQASYRAIYGSDAYLEADSQDGQWIAVLAQAIHDVNQAAIATYNAYSPSTAQGVGLSSTVKINGLARLVASNSTAAVVVVGQVGTVITNGVVADTNDNKWNLPATVTIPLAGQITVTATAQELGAITAAAGTITKINTPTRGWQTVNNPADAIPGAPVESDATLRRRQAASTAQAAQTPMAGIYGALANLPGVTALAGYENDTGVTNSFGLPAHSISFVVEGGDVVQIAQTIAQKKNPGTGTYGTTSELILDTMGASVTVNFYQPTQVPLKAAITIKALAGYVSSTGTALQQAVANYMNSQGIGAGATDGTGKIYLWRVGAIAAMMGSGLESTFDVTVVQIGKVSGALGTSDIAIAFNELGTCDVAHITLTVV